MDDDEEVGLLGHDKEPQTVGKRFAEPESHRINRKKGCKDVVLPCLPSNADGFEFTQQESDAFGRLKERLSVLYTSSNKNHEAKLKLLYENYLQPCNPPADPVTLKTKAWGNLGFQGEDPRTDFRGGGICALLCLYHVCSHCPAQLPQYRDLTARGLFLLACSSIGCTFFLRNYLHMGENVDVNRQREGIAPRRSLKNIARWICRDNIDDDNLATFKRLHTMIFTRQFDLWSSACASNPQFTIIDSGSAEKVVREHFKKILEECDYATVDEFEREFTKGRLETEKVTKFTF